MYNAQLDEVKDNLLASIKSIYSINTLQTIVNVVIFTFKVIKLYQIINTV